MGFKFRKTFDPKKHAFDPDGHRYINNVPKGEYLLKVVKSERQEGKGDNPAVAVHVYEIVDGPSDDVKGRWVRQWLHLWNNDQPGRQRYAAGKLSQICTALETGPIQDTKALEGKTLACPLEMKGYGEEGKSSIEYGNFYPAKAFKAGSGKSAEPPKDETPPPEQDGDGYDLEDDIPDWG